MPPAISSSTARLMQNEARKILPFDIPRFSADWYFMFPHPFPKSMGKTAFINSAQIGVVVDLGVTDTNNMGAAMAPAAADTIKKYLKNSNTKASDYDLIITGDLGEVGSALLKDLLLKENIVLDNHIDCGMIIYDEEQKVQSGASGCGCSASVIAAKFLPEFEKEKLNNILFIATGALLSPATSMQGESIPCIAHLVNIRSKKETKK